MILQDSMLLITLHGIIPKQFPDSGQTKVNICKIQDILYAMHLCNGRLYLVLISLSYNCSESLPTLLLRWSTCLVGLTTPFVVLWLTTMAIVNDYTML